MFPEFNTSLEFAKAEDKKDPLASFKSVFHFPKHGGKDCIYFCGNSLGLQPKNLDDAIQVELNSWRQNAIGGYFTGSHPWLYYHEFLQPALAKIMGAKTNEITVMNSLTVNLHLLMLSFYKPHQSKFKIIMEAGAFPSDQYAVETLVKQMGYDPEKAIIEIHPRSGEKILRNEDILELIKNTGSQLAMLMMGGIHYYTGQLFDMKSITEASHAVGAIAGFDLAHVAGNVPVQLHDWNVDFAAWCSYKYLNAGPGAVGGVFVHEKWASNIHTNRLGGWWGNEEKTRFKMEKGFIPKPNASGWNISTTPVFNMIGLKASLELFDEAGIENLRNKSIRLTAYLAFLLNQLTHLSFEIVTPLDEACRGAQLSLYFKENGKAIHNKMIENGIIVDYREPGVIRVAPAPMYCSYEDVYDFYRILKEHF